MKNDLIDIAYEIAKKKYKKTKFKYRELFEELVKSDISFKNLGADIYIDLISDIRFLSLGNDDWSLQEFYNYEEFEKISAAMFGLDNEENEKEIEIEEIALADNSEKFIETIIDLKDDLDIEIENIDEDEIEILEREKSNAL